MMIIRRTFMGLAAAALVSVASGPVLAQTGAATTGAATTPAVAAYKPTTNEILWDTYGVPHIYGTDRNAVFYGYGYAQAQSHASAIIRLYGEARGKGSEYWGPEYEETSVWLLTNSVPARAKTWYDQQTPAFRANLDAFAAGINAYATDRKSVV